MAGISLGIGIGSREALTWSNKNQILPLIQANVKFHSAAKYLRQVHKPTV